MDRAASNELRSCDGREPDLFLGAQKDDVGQSGFDCIAYPAGTIRTRREIAAGAVETAALQVAQVRGIDRKISSERSAECLVRCNERAQAFVDLPFSRSRRCWTVCMTSSRMPTVTSAMTARPTNVEINACQELKSRLRTLSPHVPRLAAPGSAARRMIQISRQSTVARDGAGAGRGQLRFVQIPRHVDDRQP